MSRAGTHKIDARAGFALIEAIVALAIVAMAATALFDLLSGAASRDSLARARWEALVSAKAAMRMELAAPAKQSGWHRLVGPDQREWWARTVASKESKRLRRVEIARKADMPVLLSTLTLAWGAP
jgi:prepilin-type N-terminal cleavage/methylation domain-containing protein